MAEDVSGRAFVGGYRQANPRVGVLGELAQQAGIARGVIGERLALLGGVSVEIGWYHYLLVGIRDGSFLPDLMPMIGCLVYSDAVESGAVPEPEIISVIIHIRDILFTLNDTSVRLGATARGCSNKSQGDE